MFHLEAVVRQLMDKNQRFYKSNTKAMELQLFIISCKFVQILSAYASFISSSTCLRPFNPHTNAIISVLILFSAMACVTGCKKSLKNLAAVVQLPCIRPAESVIFDYSEFSGGCATVCKRGIRGSTCC